MKTRYLSKILSAAAAALMVLPVFADDKNVAQAEFRTLPGDFEKLPALETEKWNFAFRPYGAEAASVLWSDPKVIRDVTSGVDNDEKHLATGLYVAMDDQELSFLVFGALKDTSKSLKSGKGEENILLECFFLPGDSDDPQIVNYQHFGVSSIYPYYQWKLSWMKEDRNNRWMFKDMKIESRRIGNGVVVKFSFPWIVFWDKLPVFPAKQDNFWRLSCIRWGGSFGGETWGGRVHSQTKCGYVRMPDFTPEQETKLMKTTLMKLWAQYQGIKGNVGISPDRTFKNLNFYRKSIDNLPHSWMNMNEDLPFKHSVLVPLIAERDKIGEGIADFEKLSLADQKAFYLKNAPLLGNFQYDLDDAYAAFLKKQLMKR